MSRARSCAVSALPVTSCRHRWRASSSGISVRIASLHCGLRDQRSDEQFGSAASRVYSSFTTSTPITICASSPVCRYRRGKWLRDRQRQYCRTDSPNRGLVRALSRQDISPELVRVLSVDEAAQLLQRGLLYPGSTHKTAKKAKKVKKALSQCRCASAELLEASSERTPSSDLHNRPKIRNASQVYRQGKQNHPGSPSFDHLGEHRLIPWNGGNRHRPVCDARLDGPIASWKECLVRRTKYVAGRSFTGCRS